MSGRQRLPAGEPRKASQRRARRAAPSSQVSASSVWRPGDKVRWRDRIGVFQRDVGDGEHAEIMISDRTYRVRLADLAQDAGTATRDGSHRRGPRRPLHRR